MRLEAFMGKERRMEVVGKVELGRVGNVTGKRRGERSLPGRLWFWGLGATEACVVGGGVWRGFLAAGDAVGFAVAVVAEP